MNNLQWRKSQSIQRRPLVFCACHLRNVAVMNARYCEIIKKHLKALGSSHMWVDGWGGNGNPELALVISGALASSNHMAWSAQLPQIQASSSGVHHGGRWTRWRRRRVSILEACLPPCTTCLDKSWGFCTFYPFPNTKFLYFLNPYDLIIISMPQASAKTNPVHEVPDKVICICPAFACCVWLWHCCHQQGRDVSPHSPALLLYATDFPQETTFFPHKLSPRAAGTCENVWKLSVPPRTFFNSPETIQSVIPRRPKSHLRGRLWTSHPLTLPSRAGTKPGRGVLSWYHYVLSFLLLRA